MFTLWCLPFLLECAAGAAQNPNVLGVIVARPAAQLSPEEWRMLEELEPLPEILAVGHAGSPNVPFDFSNLEKDLAAYAEHGLRVAVTLTPHLRSVAWRPLEGPDGNKLDHRQNPFDKAFVTEWTRMHREFLEQFAKDDRIVRVYVAPPSYFGEVEYYMGPDWTHPQFLCYGPLARARFAEWLEENYGTPEAVADAWGVDLNSWDDLPVPHPQNETGLDLRPEWLDLMTWRTEYLVKLVAEQIRVLANDFHGAVALKYSVGDYSAFQGTDSAALVALCRDVPKLALHCTNGHSISELVYANGLRRFYGAARVITENDGERYGRTELARIALNVLMSGTDELNFAHHVHLLNLGRKATETARSLLDVKALLTAYKGVPPRSDIAFFHSSSTRFIRAPYYRNRDVSHVYEASLANGGMPDVWGFSWARWLCLPDVINEHLVMDGDLEGRRVVILPNTWATALAGAAYDRLMGWVEEGGVLIGFGGNALAYRINPPGAAPRVERLEDWSMPDGVLSPGPLSLTGAGTSIIGPHAVALTSPAHVWERSPHPDWEAVAVDNRGRPALARKKMGKGFVYLFPQPVPGARGADADPYYAHDVPMVLRAVAEAHGCTLPYRFGIPAAPLAIRYTGRDQTTGKHLFVGGAWDASAKLFEAATAPAIEGPGEILLVDLPFAEASLRPGSISVETEHVYPSQHGEPPSHAAEYRDPTNMGAAFHTHVPWTVFEVPLPASPLIALFGFLDSPDSGSSQ